MDDKEYRIPKEYRISDAFRRAFVTMRTIRDIGRSIMRRCSGALESDGKHQVVCQLSALNKMLDHYEARYDTDKAVLEGVLIWRTILGAVIRGSDSPIPYLERHKYKTRNGRIALVRNVKISPADDLHILVSFTVETIKEA